MFICLTALSCTNNEGQQIVPGTESAYDSSAPAGTLAPHLLSGQYFRSLIVEFQPVRDSASPQVYGPSQEAQDFLVEFLQKYLDKPQGIRMIVNSPIVAPAHPNGQTGYTDNDLKQIEARTRRNYTVKGALAVYVLYADWGSDEPAGATSPLGRAYQSSSIVIYGKTMQGLLQAAQDPAAAPSPSPSPSATPPLNPTVAEATVLEHEFGHLMGLVNESNGIGADHEDPANPHHCKNQCLMNISAETSIAAAAGSAPPPLDAACVRDLKALRGGR